MAPNQKSFTLVELLVAIGIIMLLMTFLPKAWGSMTQTVDDLECRSTLKSLGRAFSLYAEDHNDFLPHHDEGNNKAPFDQCWYDLLDPYLGDEPAHIYKQEPGMSRLHQLQDGKRGHSYKMNSRLQDYKGTKSYFSPPFRDLLSVEEPRETILLFDGDIENSIKKHQPYGMYKSVENRHKGKASLLMLDFSIISSSGGHESRYWSTTGAFIWDGDLSAREQ